RRLLDPAGLLPRRGDRVGEEGAVPRRRGRDPQGRRGLGPRRGLYAGAAGEGGRAARAVRGRARGLMTAPAASTTTVDVHRVVDAVWRMESARLLGALTRVTGDVGLAEELAQDAGGVRGARPGRADGDPGLPAAGTGRPGRHP